MTQLGHRQRRPSVARHLLTRPRPPVERPLPAAQEHAFRAIWISDVHLGSRHCRAQELLEFLGTTSCDVLYLVGDVIDEWKLRKSFYWPTSHEAVLARVADIARRGTRVVYVPGNHDVSLRGHDGLALQDLVCADDPVHTTADGRRLLVTHGDRFDRFSGEASLSARLGVRAYEALLGANRAYDRLGSALGLAPRSLSLYLKHRVKEIVGFICRYEEAVASEVQGRGLDGVVCGHIHKAEMRPIGSVLYCNDGDWVESCTALVEDGRGELGLVQWSGGLRRIAATGGYSVPRPATALPLAV